MINGKSIRDRGIDEQTLAGLRAWFDSFVSDYTHGDEDSEDAVQLKIDHTYRVCREILDLGRSMDLPGHALRLAEVVALLHDVGRFPQWRMYGTFADSATENHALLGVRTLRESGALTNLEPDLCELILRVIADHNRADLTEKKDVEVLLYTRLLRDSDKLDIWRVVTEQYASSGGGHDSIVRLGFPDSPEISAPVLHRLMHGECVHIDSVRTYNDLKLLQIGWVYDLNFSWTCACALEREYVAKLHRALRLGPDFSRAHRVKDVVSRAAAYLAEKSEPERQGRTRIFAGKSDKFPDRKANGPGN